MYICKICNKNYEKLLSFSCHLYNKHKIKILDYYIKYENFEIPKCKCGQNLKHKNGISFQKTCNDKNCLGKQRKTFKHSEITKTRISKTMKKLQIEGKLKGWSINKDINRRSYPEKFFIKLLNSNNLYSKYTIIEKLSFDKYFLDFAIIDLKIDIEIDGQQHFRTEEAVNHDNHRDNFLLKNGWKVYRIAWIELKENPKNIIENFLCWIENNDNYQTYNINEILKKIKNKKIKSFKNVKRLTTDEKNDIINIIINSNIKFSEIGWVKKVTNLLDNKNKLIGCKNVYRWIKINMNDFYEINCYKKIKTKKPKYGSREKYADGIKEKSYDKYNPIMEIIKNSNIDFSKYGWVKEVSLLTGIKEQKVSKWMKRYLKDFYEMNCFKRMSTGPHSSTD